MQRKEFSMNQSVKQDDWFLSIRRSDILQNAVTVVESNSVVRPFHIEAV